MKCQDCGERFERFWPRIIRDEDRICVHCGSRNVSVGLGGGVVAARATETSSAGQCGAGAFT
ncbi:MAG: hypothetical protein RBS78_07520 [Coriobacteriia bacterium]|nr:hypothetical protein [Coriobacteriia bacterium]